MKPFSSNRLIILFTFGLTLLLFTNQTLIIASPAINPFDESKIPYSYANIGNIPYGKTLTFDLVENKTLDLCQPVKQSQRDHFLTPAYLLIDASFGTCSFTTEAIAAQQIGAKGVIFVSDTVNYFDKIVQVDDGNGRKVHITVLFINTQTYRKLHDLENIHIKVSFEVHLTEVANITYFLSASGRSNYIFLRQFQTYYKKIKNFINFRPLYFLTNCPDCNQRDCLVSKQFCTFEMDQYKQNLGQLILKEQIRQWNLWKQKGTEKYFQYMNLFDQYCTTDWINSVNCGMGMMKSLGIDELTTKQVPSELMTQWKIQQLSAGFLTIPQITINNQLYAGSYDPQEIFQAICSSLINPPQECTGQQIPHTSIKIAWIIGSIIIAVLISLIVGCWIYRKCVKKEMTEEISTKVNELVAKYATQVQQHTRKSKNRLKMRLNEEL